MIFPTYFRPIRLIAIPLSIPLAILLPSSCQTSQSTKLPLEPQLSHGGQFSKIIYPAADRRPYIKTKNSQLGKMRWLVDSGATHSVIFDDGKKSIISIITRDSESKNNVHGIFSTEQKKLSLFSYQASSRSEGTPTLTGYTMNPRGQHLRSRVDGIIGIHSLQQHDAVMFPRQKLLIWNAHTTHFKNGHKVNLRRHSKSGHLIATVQHGDQTLYLIIDSGASKSVISSVSAKKIKPASRSRSLRLSGVHQSRANNASIKKLQLRLSPSQPVITADFIVTDLSNLKKHLNSANDVHIDGIMGYDMLSRYCHAIDFGQGSLYLSTDQ